MVDRAVYTLRGWLAFVAFLDLAQALRSWLDKDVFLGSYFAGETSLANYTATNVSKGTKTLFFYPLSCTYGSVSSIVPVPSSTARLLIAYSIQNGTILLVCAFCIHHWP